MKSTFKNTALALTLGVVAAGAFTVSNSQHSSLNSKTTLSENAAIASVSAEGCQCVPGHGVCVYNGYFMIDFYLKCD